MHTHPSSHPADPDTSLLPPLRDPLFDGLRAELAELDAPPGVRKELLAAFVQHQARQKAALPWWRKLAAPGWKLAGGGVALAAVLLTVLLATGYRIDAPPAPVTAAALRESAPMGDFTALTSLERIEQDPAPHMLATTMPRAALMSLGIAVDPQDAGDTVQAEMLVGADGSPLALRLAVQ